MIPVNRRMTALESRGIHVPEVCYVLSPKFCVLTVNVVIRIGATSEDSEVIISVVCVFSEKIATERLYFIKVCNFAEVDVIEHHGLSPFGIELAIIRVWSL